MTAPRDSTAGRVAEVNWPKPRDSASPRGAYDLNHFTPADMVRCGHELRRLAAESSSLEEAAQAVTRHLYDRLRDAEQCSCVLVRFFITQRYAKLPEDLRRFAAEQAAGLVLEPGTNCLTLLASAGDDPQWNSRRDSRLHKCIPLASNAMAERFPVLSELIRQFDLTSSDATRPAAEIPKDAAHKSIGLLYVPRASESPLVPAQQDFVVPRGVVSVLGIGDLLPNGALFALLMFTRVAVDDPVSEMFRAVGLNLKLGLLDVCERPVFAQ